MLLQTKAKTVEKNQLSLNSKFEHKFREWRQNNPIPSFRLFAGVYFFEEDNLELFWDMFSATFEELYIIFEGTAYFDDKVFRKSIYDDMVTKYSPDGTEIDKDLDSDFEIEFRDHHEWETEQLF